MAKVTRASNNFRPDPVTIEALRRCRTLVLEARPPLGSESYRRVSTLVAAIDDIAELLVGDRELFWRKPHSTP